MKRILSCLFLAVMAIGGTVQAGRGPTLVWDGVPAGDQVSRYLVYEKRDRGDRLLGMSATTSFALGRIKGSRTYYVMAENAAGISAPSALLTVRR